MGRSAGTLGESIDITGDGDRNAGFQQRQKANEDYQLGPVSVTAISYVFFEDQLTMIEIKADTARVLSEIAHAKYGRPIEENKFTIDEAYRYKDTLRTVKEDLISKMGTMALVSIAGVKRWEQRSEGTSQRSERCL